MQKGLGGLQNLWQKAPSRHELWEKATHHEGAQGAPGGYPAAIGGVRRLLARPGRGAKREERSPATFERTPLPESPVGGAGFRLPGVGGGLGLDVAEACLAAQGSAPPPPGAADDSPTYI